MPLHDQRVSKPSGFSKRARRIPRSMALLSILFTAVAFAGPLGLFGSKDDADKQRQAIQDLSRDTLNELYASKPELKDRVAKAPGYAVFRKTDVNLLLLASGNGCGLLVDNKADEKTYMRVASLGGGVGMGVNDLRVVFIFHDAAVMKTFLDQGWQFAGSADAGAKHGDKGAAASQTAKANVDFKEGTVAAGASSNAEAGAGAGKGTNQDGAKDESKDAPKGAGKNAATTGPMEIYQFTKNGISLQATVAGTKYWKDSELNK